MAPPPVIDYIFPEVASRLYKSVHIPGIWFPLPAPEAAVPCSITDAGYPAVSAAHTMPGCHPKHGHLFGQILLQTAQDTHIFFPGVFRAVPDRKAFSAVAYAPIVCSTPLCRGYRLQPDNCPAGPDRPPQYHRIHTAKSA